MFVPLAPKPKSLPPQRSAVAAQRPSRTVVTQGQLLQRTIGNQALLQLIAPRLPGPIQAKLNVGAVDDPLEREADDVADRVMRMPDPEVSGAARQVSRRCAECEEEEKLQKTPAGVPRAASGDAPATVHEVLRTPGRPLDAATRAYFEPRFGQDFSRVRVHTGTLAEQSARDVNAHAYTVGHNIVLGADRFVPGMHDGRRLIAHELTHVVQQSGAGQVRAGRNDDAGAPSPILGRSSEKRIMRKGFESTVQICHRELESRHFEVSQGGLRVVLILNELDKDVHDCRDFNFGVTLTRSEDWWPDDEIGTCEASTGGTRSFSFANLTSGTYYLTIWRTFDHPYCCLEGNLLVFDEPASKDSDGCTRDKDPSAMDIVHGALDIAGFIPVLGAVPDGINAGIYALEGDWSNAGLSAVAMVPGWGDGVKLGAIGVKSAIKITEKAAIRLGEEGIAKGLKEVKAASKVEKAALETTEEAAKVVKAEKGAAQEVAKAEKGGAQDAAKAEKEAAENVVKKEEKGGKEKGGKWTCYGWSAVLQIPSALPEHKCPLDGRYIQGPSVSGPSQAAACLAAKHAFNAMMPRGCRPKHLDCRCEKR